MITKETDHPLVFFNTGANPWKKHEKQNPWYKDTIHQLAALLQEEMHPSLVCSQN